MATLTAPHVLAQVVAKLDEFLETKPSAPIVAETELVADLKLDSITSVELLAELEDGFGVSIPLDQFATLRTVGDVVAAVLAAAGQPAEPSQA